MPLPEAHKARFFKVFAPTLIRPHERTRSLRPSQKPLISKRSRRLNFRLLLHRFTGGHQVEDLAFPEPEARDYPTSGTRSAGEGRFVVGAPGSRCFSPRTHGHSRDGRRGFASHLHQPQRATLPNNPDHPALHQLSVQQRRVGVRLFAAKGDLRPSQPGVSEANGWLVNWLSLLSLN